MPTINDEEFGAISYRRNAKATHVRIRVAPDGRLRASLPLYAPLFAVKRLIRASRDQLRAMLQEEQGGMVFTDAMQIGKSHHLTVRQTDKAATKVSRHGQLIVVALAANETIESTATQRLIRDRAIEALRIEAKSYLPGRLKFLADKFGYDYQKVRFSHASGRWGSCSTSGTISLNIALMKLPFELIDYVLIHELSHTVHMNHSAQFWLRVAEHDPDFRSHRRDLKKHTPSI